MVADGRSSSALPKYRQFVGISTEFSYIRPHPFECLSLVFQSEVAGKYHVSRTCETKKSQPIIQRHENHILFQKPLGEGEIVGTISRYESTAMYGNSDSSPGVSFKLYERDLFNSFLMFQAVHLKAEVKASTSVCGVHSILVYFKLL